jgi:hypothetical protein
MTTPTTITSLSQGILRKQPPSEEAYWERLSERPHLEDLPFWQSMKIEWPNWSLRRRADRG